MYEGVDTNRTGAIGGLYLRSRTSRQAALGGQSNRPHLFVIFVAFVIFEVKEAPFVSVPSLLL
jgi:hypothetical protein